MQDVMLPQSLDTGTTGEQVIVEITDDAKQTLLRSSAIADVRVVLRCGASG